MPDLALAGRVDEPVRELWWAWIVAIQGEGFDPARPETVLLGLGPLLVDKFTGEAVHSGSNFAWSVRRIERERGYRAWWRFWGPEVDWSRSPPAARVVRGS